MIFNNKTKSWPKIDSCNEVQEFIDNMCHEHAVPSINVIIKSPSWVEWFAGLGVSACAFWPHEGEEDAGFGRYIVFDGQTCRISGKERTVPIKVESVRLVVERIHTVIHEFIHHYFHHHHGVNTDDHGPLFRVIEKKMNAEYGIYYVYSTNGYATMFHNFWGKPFGKRRPTPEERGWNER